MTAKKTNPFKLRDFRGVDPRHLERLEKLKIKNAGQMLAAGATKKQRVALAKEAGVPVAVDLDIAPSNTIMQYIGTADQYLAVAKMADILKPCDAAAIELAGTDDLEQAIQKIHKEFGNKLTAITAAAKGSVLFDGKNVHWEEVLDLSKVGRKLVDPCGAGDAYFGGMNAAISLFGLDAPLEDIGTLANATAGLCCSAEGAFPVAPESPKGEIRKLIAANRGEDVAAKLID